MTTAEGLEARAASLADLFEKRLKLRGRGLEAKLRRAGNRVPKSVRREAAKLVDAQRFAGHPKLMMQVDAAGLDAAYVHCERWLNGIDLKSRRIDRMIGMAAGMAFNLLVVAALFLGYLVWAGHL